LPLSEVQGLAAEVAKCLKLVAPANMGAEQQTVWLHAAVDALQDIHQSEVAAVSAELRRSITRPAQIVPEIARLVSEKRQRANRSSEPTNPLAGVERQVDEEARERRQAARGRDQVEAAWRGERSARQDAGLRVEPVAKPFTPYELANMAPAMRSLGLKYGHLIERADGTIEEAIAQ
jgi:hypothetical protein